MSTRSSLYAGESGYVHLYHEIHDDLYHLEIKTGPTGYSFVNVILTPDLARELLACLNEEGKTGYTP